MSQKIRFSVDPKDGEISILFNLDSNEIACNITFDNAHLVAQALTSNPEAARALYNELSYWIDNNQI